MNPADFQRNFQASFFGLVPTDKILASFPAGHRSHGCDLVPCTMPRFVTATSVVCQAIVKFERDFIVHKHAFPWKTDLDEDTSVMRCGIPGVGMIQIDDATMYLMRAPIRDTPRGYAPNHHSLYNNWPNEFALSTDTLSVVWNVFNKTRLSWAGALRKVDDGECASMAVDRFLALGSLPGRKYTQILYKNKGSIGFINGQGIPVLFPEHNTYMLYEYVRKISGLIPIVK